MILPAWAASSSAPNGRNGLLTGKPLKFDGGHYRVAAQIFVPGAAKPTVLVAALDRGGAAGLGDVAIVGTEEEVEYQLHAFSAAGVTDLNAVVFPAPGGDSAGTYEFLGALSRRGLA